MRHILINFVLITLALVERIPLVKSFLFWKRKSLSITTILHEHKNEHHSDDESNLLLESQLVDFEEDDDKKLAWARHAIMSVAASVMGVPTDVFTTPPMVDPRPPKTHNERAIRAKVNNLLLKGYPDPLSGFEIPNEEIDLMHKINSSTNSGHNPSIYGEITFLGTRQLFHYMHIYDTPNGKPISFIDLGSGNGKLVVQAYLEVPNLNSVQGVELSPSRHQVAITSFASIVDEAKKIRQETLSSYGISKSYGIQQDTEVKLLQDDLFQMDISEATHIYVASLCFTDAMIESLGNKLKLEGRNLNCVATLKPLPSSFEKEAGFAREARYVEMSWTKPMGIGGIVYLYSK